MNTYIFQLEELLRSNHDQRFPIVPDHLSPQGVEVVGGGRTVEDQHVGTPALLYLFFDILRRGLVVVTELQVPLNSRR
jgi:hypothetical protein